MTATTCSFDQVPKNANGQKIELSIASPTAVEPIVLVQSQRPLVATFIFASTNEFANSPVQNASSEARTIRHVCPNIMFTAEFCSGDIVPAAGNAVTMYDISD